MVYLGVHYLNQIKDVKRSGQILQEFMSVHEKTNVFEEVKEVNQKHRE